MTVGSIIRKLGLWILIGLIICLTLAALFSDFGKIKNLISGITSGWFTAILGAVMFNYLLRFLKWCFFLRLLKISISISDSLWIFFSAFTMVLSPGKVGELMKSFLLKSRYGLPLAQTAPIVLAERITDLLGLLLLAAIGCSRFAYGGKTLTIIGFILFTGMFLMTRGEFWHWFDKHILASFPRFAKLRSSFKILEESTKNLLSIGSMVFMIPLSALSWAGEGVALFFIFRSMGVEVQELLGISVFAHAFSSIVGALSFLPGGLLITEGTLGMFLVFVGIGKDQAVSATLLIRTATLWFAVVLGTAVFLLGRRSSDLVMKESPEKL